MKKYIAIIVLLIMVLPACVTYDKCVAKFGSTGDTTYIPYTVIVPKDSVITHIMIDSIPYMLPGDTHYYESTESKIKIKYWKDMYLNAINIQAITDTIIIRDTIPCPPSPVFIDYKRIYRECYLRFCAYAFMFFVVMGLLYAFIYPLIKKK